MKKDKSSIINNNPMNSTEMEKLLHWAAIIESSDDAIISNSIDGYITSWNNGAQRLYGYTDTEIIGQQISILMPTEKKDDFPFIMSQLKLGKKIEHYHTQRVTKSGKIIHVSITVSPIKDERGNIIGASKIARNITDLVEQDKKRDEFIITTSHELKTPLTSQKAFGELLEKMITKNGDEIYLPYIKKINQQTNKLSKLINDLLEVSNGGNNKLKIEKKVFNLDEFIDDICETMQMNTKKKLVNNVKTNTEVLADKQRLGQVFTNLISNAIKYSPLAKEVIIFNHPPTLDTVIICVQDFGIGIDPFYHQKIFNRFFRIMDKNENTFPGMGIGLNVSMDLVKKHNGEILVKSKKGEGSTFSVVLPIVYRVNIE